MYKNILVLDDGTEISAGKVGHNAIRALTCTETVSSTTDLCPGAACSGKLEITIWVEPGSALVITSGTRLAHYREDTSGTRTLCGTYWAVKPTRQTRNTYKIYAYDAVSRLDGIQSAWLRSIQGQFPMSLWAFAQAVAARCGVEIANAALPRSGDYQVQAFYADDLTGRQLLAWVAEAACTFLRATPSGRLEFAWYTERVAPGIGPTAGQAWTALSPAGELLETADGEVWTFGQEQLGYYSGGLSYEDYETAPIDKVQIRQTDDDVGVLYPADETGTNALVILGNLLLTTQTADALRPVAQAIYETMQGVTYTPLSVDIPYTADAPAPGEIITVTDAYDRQMQTYVMSRTIAGQRVTLESTGNARRDSTAAVNEQKYTNLQGKVLEISANVDGLTTTAKDLQGKQAELTLAVDGLASTVEANYDALKDYADDAANQARDEAIQSAVDQAEEAFGQELQLYPTKVEMDSAIRQSAGEISSQVNMTLEGYATKEYTDTAAQDAKDFASSAAQGALDQANADTDSKLALYPTTVEMNSAITQTASQITSQVSQTLTQYSTTEESQSYADSAASGAETAAKQYADQAAGQAEDAANAATDNKLKNYSTTVQMNSAIDQKANQITLSVNQTLTRYSTTEESEQYADQAAGQAEDAANAATDNKLKNYSTTVQMNSAIQQSASEILSTVSNTYTTEVQAASAGRNLVSNTAFIGYDPQDSAATIQDGVLTIKPEDSQKRLEFPLDFTPYGIQEIKKISPQNHVTISGEYRIDEKIYYNGSVSRPNYVALEITTESGETTELKVPDTLILVNVTSGWVSFSKWYNPSLGNITSARLIVVCDRAYQGSISWRNLKVEMGQTATPWSAAPEDVVLQIGYSEELSQQVSEAFDEKLTFYPTSTEMNSAIKQSADSIQLTVDETLTGYVTKDDITLYPTTVQMNSAIEQRANQIELSVEQTLTGYSTTSQMQAAIDLAVDGITLEVSNNGTSSTLILKSGSTVLSSPQINITGFVTFTNLSTSGQTTINAGNISTGTMAAARINTGTINGSSGNTSWNLGTGDFRSGPSSGTRVQLSASGMRTYSDGNLTGVITHKYGQSAYCCNSVTTCLGWTNGFNGPGTGGSHYRPWYGNYDDGTFRGLIYDDSDRSIGIGRYVSLGLQGGSKNKLIVSSFGIIGIESMESPEPTFWDMGSGVCDDAGECLIVLDPRFVEAIDRQYRPRWLITPTDDLGPLWVEKVHLGAVVHGAPGQTFDWAVNAAQQDCAGKYAPEMSGGTRRIEVALIDALDDTDAEGERELLSATAATEEEEQQTALYLLDLEASA